MKQRQTRVVNNLRWVKAADPPPFEGAPRRLKGMQAKGKAFERKVGEHLKGIVEAGEEGNLWIGPWFQFEDDNGPGLAQPDALLLKDDVALIFECKLKQTPAAAPQLLLYGTLTEALLEVPWVGIQVFKFPSVRRDDTWIEGLPLVSPSLRTVYNYHLLL